MEEKNTIQLEMEDGTEMECEVLGIFEAGEYEYIALANDSEEEILVYRYTEDGDDIKLDIIEDEKEAELVEEALCDFFGYEDMEHDHHEGGCCGHDHNEHEHGHCCGHGQGKGHGQKHEGLGCCGHGHHHKH